MEPIKDKDIKWAIKVLGLSSSYGTISDLKNAYKKKSKVWSKDKTRAANKKLYEEKIKELNDAYNIALKFCEQYRINFGGDFENKGGVIDDFKNKFFDDDDEPTWN